MSNVNGKADPSNISGIQITYDGKTVTIPASDLRLESDITTTPGIGGDIEWNAVYDIKSSNNEKNIVAFYDNGESDAGALAGYELYEVRIVENGSSIGKSDFPVPPEHISYTFVSWNDEPDGNGTPFDYDTTVNGDMNVYARNVSGMDVHTGTVIHVMNTDNALINRYIELYNADPENQDITPSDFTQDVMDSMKITVHGQDGNATNPDYWLSALDGQHNGWSDSDYFLVLNYNADKLPEGHYHNTHIPATDISGITVEATIDGETVSVYISKGAEEGQFSVAPIEIATEWKLVLNGKPSAPTGEDLTGDPDDEDDPAILGEGAVTVDCTNSKVKHDPVTYGLIPGSYTAPTNADVYWANDADGNGAYYVDITNIAPGDYVAAYNTDVASGHSLSPANQENKTITLKWAGSEWKVSSEIPVTFTVTCDDEELPVYDITGITKELVDSDEEKTAAAAAGIGVEDYNYPDAESGKVIIPKDDSVILLYAITVTGRAGATFAVTDENAELVEVEGVEIEQSDDTFSGTIPEGETITFYVSKTFDADDLKKTTDGEGTVLKNTATVEGTGENDEDPNNDDDTEETPAEEEDPTKPDFDADDLAGVTVQVLCVQNPTDHKYESTLDEHPDAYETKIEACEAGDPIDGTSGQLPTGYDWKCTVSISKEYFVKYFNDVAKLPSNLWGEHELAESGETTKIVFYYGSRGWERLGSTSSVIIQVREKSTGTYTLTYDANGGIFGIPGATDDGTIYAKEGLEPGEHTLSAYVKATDLGYIADGVKVILAGWTMKEPKEEGKVYRYNDPDIPKIEETVTITNQPVTVYAVWGYDENGDEEADINQIVVKPADITIYMGGKPYEGVVDGNGDPVATVDENGNIVSGNANAGLPEPGFIVTLPAGAPADTVITNLVFEEADGGDRTWQFETYDGQEGTVVYKLVPQGDEQTATRVQFTKANGEVIVSDKFTVGLEVNTAFTMALYKGSGATAVGKIVADIGEKSYSVNSDPTGTLTVRGTTDGAQYAEMTAEEARSWPEEGKPAVMAPTGTTYAINGGDVQVADTNGVALLFDAIIDHEGEDRTELLQDRAEAYFNTESIRPETGKEFTYEFKYLDLVDQNNGNVWVAAQDADGKDRDVTVYWPLPEGTDADTNFTLLHFKGLHREMATADIESQIERCDVEAIDVEVVGSHVTFKIGSSGFSPFALVWQEKDGTTPPATQYKVEFKAGSHGSLSGTTTFQVDAGDKVPSVPTVNEDHNYDFTGWKDSDGNTYTSSNRYTYSITKDMTFTAQYTYTGGGEYNPKDATLRFNSRGGTEFDDIVHKEPFEYNPYNNIPSRPGYRFTGWYDSSRLDNRYDEDKEIDVPMGITTVFAGWEETTVPGMLNGDDHYAYIQGYADGSVRPNANITRAQVATIFFRLLDEDVRDDYLTTYNTFPDVDEDYWANTAISTMASLGVIYGRNSGNFDPNAYITRAEFAAICARFDDSGVSGITTFTDTVGHWAEDEISRAAALGWIQGYADGTFRPNQYITRAQAVTMINRVLCRLPEDTDDLLSGMNTWTDCHEDDWFYLAIQEATNSHDFVAKDRVYESWTDLNRDPDWSRYE